MNEDIKQIALRLKEFRKRLSLNQKEFASHFKVGQQFISGLESAKYGIPMSFIDQAAKDFNLSKGWILYGEGQMFTSKNLGIPINEIEILNHEKFNLYKSKSIEILFENNQLKKEFIQNIKEIVNYSQMLERAIEDEVLPITIQISKISESYISKNLSKAQAEKEALDFLELYIHESDRIKTTLEMLKTVYSNLSNFYSKEL